MLIIMTASYIAGLLPAIIIWLIKNRENKQLRKDNTRLYEDNRKLQEQLLGIKSNRNVDEEAAWNVTK